MKQLAFVCALAALVAGCDGGGSGGNNNPSTRCSAATDCAGEDSACSIRTCVAGACGVEFAEPGVATTDELTTDCKRPVCDGKGKVVTENLAAGTACASNSGKVCSASGACVACTVGSDCETGVCVANACAAVSCFDTVQNGSETDVDCGGACPSCGANRACGIAGDCESSICTNGVCQPGVCGDGVTNGTESCDDKNSTATDGCDSCVRQQGYSCSGTPSVCETTCGDAFIAGTEACDDGNTASNDGCASTCALEAGFACMSGVPTVCMPVCGDGLVRGAESCDDNGVIDNDGCSSSCETDPGFTCAGEPSVCAPTCGDGAIVPPETCDDNGTASGDGCSATCAVEDGFTCVGFPSTCGTICGDGITAGAETCDDNNTSSADGCSDMCAVEPGYACTGSPSVCAPVCGDGAIVAPETCDDGDAASADGCSASCLIESGFTCVGAPSVCGTTCGDGIRAGTEACDDADAAGGDGCSASCAIEPGYQCSGSPSTCAPICGDAVLISPEACDDGDVMPGDGCSATCTVEAGYACSGTPSTCAPVCGDGVVTAPEACDDSGTASGDGCSQSCTVESGWTCSGAPSSCSRTEVEPNDTCVQAAAQAPYTGSEIVYAGSIIPVGDADIVSFTTTAYADIRIETYGLSVGTCTTGDTYLELRGTDCTTVLVADDDDGLSTRCSLIDPAVDPAARRLPPGTYFVRVNESGNDADISQYHTRITFPAICGDNVVEGSEQCDGSAGCLSDCTVPPSCGDGFISGTETCDDGNVTAGDGCSSLCAVESGFACFDEPSICGPIETEPNNTCLALGGVTPYPAPVTVTASISPIGDEDIFAFSLAAYSDVKLETFVGTPLSCSDGAVRHDTVMELRGPDCDTVLATDDQSGPGSCAAIDPATVAAARNLAPGTYYVRVVEFFNDELIPEYKLRISLSAVCGDGVVQGSEECDRTANCSASCRLIP